MGKESRPKREVDRRRRIAAQREAERRARRRIYPLQTPTAAENALQVKYDPGPSSDPGQSIPFIDLGNIRTPGPSETTDTGQ